MTSRKRRFSFSLSLLFILCLAAASLLVYDRYVRSSAAPPYGAALGEQLTEIPAYAGEASVPVNGNIPFFTEEECQLSSFFENYSPLDALGRTGQAFACLDEAHMATGEREDLSFVRPSGWQNHEYAFLEETYQSSWLYNRCHLIAWQLTGQNANPENLLTGTQYLNHKGMLPYEKQVMQYLYDTGGHVLYRVTPVYRDDQLVAQGVLLEARSVEDEGRGLCFCVYCFNVEPGVVIHYRTGDNYADSAPAKVH